MQQATIDNYDTSQCHSQECNMRPSRQQVLQQS